MKRLLLFLSFSILLITACTSKKETEDLIEDRMKEPRSTPSRNSIMQLVPDLTYQSIHKEIEFDNLVMLGRVGRNGVDGEEGKILRVLRFKNITDAVEDRYNLPRHILLAMIAQESNGVDLLANGTDDGGFGLCHMQPLLADQFGLNTYAKCKELVCKKHGVALRNVIEENSYDRKKVFDHDDRLHPILNIDAVARMLVYYMNGPKIGDMGPFRTALCRYAGKYNYQIYWKNVKGYMKKLSSDKYIRRIETKFNKANPDLLIDGVKADFDLYVSVSQTQNENYGLSAYKALPKYTFKNSEVVLRTYMNFL